MNTPQRGVGKHCWDYSLKIHRVSAVGETRFSGCQSGSRRHRNPPCPGAPRHIQLGVRGPTAALQPQLLGKGAKPASPAASALLSNKYSEKIPQSPRPNPPPSQRNSVHCTTHLATESTQRTPIKTSRS